MTREFDLNIERVLENWTVAYALTEVIANALDEQALTGSREPEIFAGDQELDITSFGSVLRPKDSSARPRIYVNGLRVAEEDNFLFSYNITSPTAALRRALNRERSNVGRGAYTDRVKAILLACDEDAVIDALIADLQNYERGSQHDETQWLDVGLHACKQLNARRKVIFLTAFELATAPEFVQRARNDGYEIVIVPDSIRTKLRGLRDPLGNPLRDLERYRDEWHDSFQFTFVSPEEFTWAERQVWGELHAIFAARGGMPGRVLDVRISETMRLMEGRYHEATGLWDESEGQIIVKRTELQSLAKFAGTVLHEVSHAISGASDQSLEFEQAPRRARRYRRPANRRHTLMTARQPSTDPGLVGGFAGCLGW